MIPLPEKPMLTAHADINDFIIKTYKYLKQLAENLNISLPAYSDTPQLIGTWVDGSPIYRKAFDVLLKDMPEADYADILNNSAFTVGIISGSGSAYLISAFCAYADANGSLYPCGIDTFNDFLIDFGVPDGVTILEDQSDCTSERIYGYIDFIRTGDDDV